MALHPQQAHPVMAVQGMTTIHPLEVEEVMGLQPPVQEALMGEVEIVMGVVEEGATEDQVMEVLMGVTAAEVVMEAHLEAAEAMVAAATAVDHLVVAVAMATAAAVEAMEAAAVVVAAAEAMVTAAAAVAMEAAVEVVTAAAVEASVAAVAVAEEVEEAAMVKTKSSLTTKSMPLASQPTSQKKILPHFLAQLV